MVGPQGSNLVSWPDFCLFAWKACWKAWICLQCSLEQNVSILAQVSLIDRSNNKGFPPRFQLSFLEQCPDTSQSALWRQLPRMNLWGKLLLKPLNLPRLLMQSMQCWFCLPHGGVANPHLLGRLEVWSVQEPAMLLALLSNDVAFQTSLHSSLGQSLAMEGVEELRHLSDSQTTKQCGHLGKWFREARQAKEDRSIILGPTASSCPSPMDNFWMCLVKSSNWSATVSMLASSCVRNTNCSRQSHGICDLRLIIRFLVHELGRGLNHVLKARLWLGARRRPTAAPCCPLMWKELQSMGWWSHPSFCRRLWFHTTAGCKQTPTSFQIFPWILCHLDHQGDLPAMETVEPAAPAPKLKKRRKR